jgi:hypothetical protein
MEFRIDILYRMIVPCENGVWYVQFVITASMFDLANTF